MSIVQILSLGIQFIEKFLKIKVYHSDQHNQLLFVIYINDLPRRIKSLTKLYADDTKILSVINSEECPGKIQADLDNAF